jgi:ankyrin repeat protein
MASQMGDLEVGTWLLHHGADVNARMKDGKTPLSLAVEYGHLEAVRLLLEYHAEVNSQEDDGTTPLLCALHWPNERSDVAHLLLEYSADVHVCDDSDERQCGDTPLHLAAENHDGHLDLDLDDARLLLVHHTVVKSEEDNGTTPLL